MRRLLLCLIILALPAIAQAQTHYCDTTPPAAGTFVAGAIVAIQTCNDGKDSTGTVTVAPTAWKLYDNATAVTIAMTKGTTSAVSGRTVYSGNYTAPATPGVHTLQATALVGASVEGPKSNVFTLTVVAAVPSAPTNLSGQ